MKDRMENMIYRVNSKLIFSRENLNEKFSVLYLGILIHGTSLYIKEVLIILKAFHSSKTFEVLVTKSLKNI
jgi:hypothetical protein